MLGKANLHPLAFYTIKVTSPKTAEDDPLLAKKRGTRVLAKFTSLHPYNIEQKTELIVEHFRENVKHRLGGRAKAMVVTSSRLHAVRFKLAFERYIKENGYTDIRPLVAFSGTVRDPDTGFSHTEPGMNVDVVTGQTISEGALPSPSEFERRGPRSCQRGRQLRK